MGYLEVIAVPTFVVSLTSIMLAIVATSGDQLIYPFLSEYSPDADSAMLWGSLGYICSVLILASPRATIAGAS